MVSLSFSLQTYRVCNVYMDREKPWALFCTEPSVMWMTLYLLMVSTYILAMVEFLPLPFSSFVQCNITTNVPHDPIAHSKKKVVGKRTF